MTDDRPWRFKGAELDLEGDMTLILVSRSGKKLSGTRVEFADGATTELRTMVKTTTAMIEASEPRDYEASLRIGHGQYLAVPDQLIELKATLLPETASKRKIVKSVGSRVAEDEADTSSTETTIETDPQVRNLLRNAAGLPLASAQAIAEGGFQFYAIVVGSQPQKRTAFVRKLNPSRGLDRGKILFSMGERLQRVRQPLLSLDDRFDLAVTNDGIAVIDQGVFDSLFRDSATLVDRYPRWAKAFSTIGLSKEQSAKLVARCQNNMHLATRLRQIHESGHLARGKVTLDQVLQEADRVAGGRAQFLEDGKLNFDCADVSTLLKLLNDDLFIGGLSKEPFEAGSKAKRPSR